MQDDWDASDDDKPKPAAGTATAPMKKKKTLKQKLAEKEAAAAEAVSHAPLKSSSASWHIHHEAELNGSSELAEPPTSS